MAIEHTREFGIYYWDTFGDETILVGEADTKPEAQDFVAERYRGRIRTNGADQVDIVDSKGNLVDKFRIG